MKIVARVAPLARRFCAMRTFDRASPDASGAGRAIRAFETTFLDDGRTINED